ncbi:MULTISPECIES: 50S ribosomal protein L11 methyltransferase [unclassified Marinobacterium]|uniref:50S ribosomal protein L11 methyltransferase n=1 Tax=unclassified Marinobacterium TaxID=2644139 RepID=UPI00156A26F8|nr:MULTISPECIES: 50S ribosomal protein L11 methyltransferase [unclassified Marinobacterium]NRP16024.1 Ribosomal protein L11 methyltransferase [Marinobacterium sp. xm-a-152]NRP37784.1 Ribosomal protein L11 methyltransferase [Marinobacterium sp. xm-a-121]NRP52797.1 Ribosomal protein L11 methyltransferase [Marinobacterium sp. xm-v-242]NRP56392.1 Ribosomal protein L11 methyltransferase [Marinobacterium sp. xm-d-510]NRP77378.1 Ribosomal protein L11 methyltransferase [Marinobacterium sp. xm-m-383]
MPWLQIKVVTNPDIAEFYEDLLLEAGCAAVTFEDAKDQPIFEPELGTTPLWGTTVITGLFAAEHDLESTLAFLNEQKLSVEGGDTIEFKAEILEDKDWEREWMTHYHPMQFGSHFWVCPSWIEVPDANAVNLMLDPGLAFGTGTHPTTALCLEWLASEPLQNRSVIDYGCGSGILGIAAILLGASAVSGVDIDPQALTATQDNLVRNGLDKERLPVFFPESFDSEPVDLVIANILAGPLKELAPTLAELVKSGGQLILSGLLIEQADELISTYSEWFDMEPPSTKEEWVRLTGRKR